MQEKAKGTQTSRLAAINNFLLSLKKHNTDKIDAKEVRVNRVIKRNYLCCGAFIYTDGGF